MALPQRRADGTLPPGEHPIANLDEIRAAFPATTARRRTLEAELVRFVEAVRRLALGTELVIDGSYMTGKPEPSDLDLALLSTGAIEPEVLRLLRAEGVDVDAALDVFVEPTRPGFDGWVRFFSNDSAGHPRGVVLLTI